MSEFELAPEYVALQAEARALAASVADIAERADEASSIDPEMRERLRDSGLAAVAVAREYGGRFPAVDSLAMTVVREAFASESAHLDSMFAMQGIGSYPISVAGADAVRKRWLPAVARLEAIAALALTEPGVGSDLRAIATTVAEDGDALVVNGHKSFITNAGDAAFYCVLGKEAGAYTLVLVPTDTPGVTVTQPHQIIAPHVLGDVVMTDVRVPVDHRLGASGKGFDLVLATLATFRVSVAGAAVGLASSGTGRGGTARRRPRAVRHAAGPPRRGAGGAGLVVDRHRDGPGADLPGGRRGHPRRARLAAPLVAGQGRGDRGGRPRRRPGRAGDGPLRPGARQQDRAAVPGGATDADLRGRHRGHLRLAGQTARQVARRRGFAAVIVDAHCHVWPDHIAKQVLAARPVGLDPRHDGTLAGLLRTMDEAGIDRALTLGIANVPRNVARTNEWIGGVDRSRFTPFGTVHPHCPMRTTCGT